MKIFFLKTDSPKRGQGESSSTASSIHQSSQMQYEEMQRIEEQRVKQSCNLIEVLLHLNVASLMKMRVRRGLKKS